MTTSLFSTLFRSKKNLVDDDTAEWIYDTFQWALSHFDRDEFMKRSRLIQPNNDFFPGKVDSIHALSETIFKHTLNYAGLKHWPFELQAPEHFQGLPPPKMDLQSTSSTSRDSANPDNLPAPATQEKLYISYRPQQTSKPEDLSSTYAHLLAQHLALQTQQHPPGGKELFVAGTEVLAVFMGFGVMFANSAYTYKGGCGSCYNANANRQSALSEDEATFALALYCHLKAIPAKEASKYLKPHLKSGYKKAIRQIKQDDRVFH